jgi:NTP pyrophosphatase (non-canonical NTP hydrolase)
MEALVEGIRTVDGQPPPLMAVLSGTFRRSRDALRDVFEALCEHYLVLSPRSLDWVNPDDPFVKAAQEEDEPPASIERRHLEAIRQADFVWLFAPDGYVGSSAAMEVGFAHAAGIPVLTDQLPTDDAMASLVQVVPGGVDDVEAALSPDPGQGLAALQEYYKRMAARRGWDEESPRDTLLLITEELGELARAVRNAEGLARDGGFGAGVGHVGDELADVQLYLVHLASALGVDLAAAVTEKELVNARRHLRAERVA